MILAGFESLDAAKEHRAKQGGWIFVPEMGAPIWFRSDFRPSDIFAHPATRGRNGTLV